MQFSFGRQWKASKDLICTLVLAVMLDFLSGSASGQDTKQDDRLNGLRPQTKQDSGTGEPPTIDWAEDVSSLVSEDPTEEDESQGEWLIIGSADMRLASGTDDETTFLIEAEQEEIATDSDEKNLAMALEFANASLSHSASCYWLVVRPSLIPFKAPSDTSLEKPSKSIPPATAKSTGSEKRSLLLPNDPPEEKPETLILDPTVWVAEDADEPSSIQLEQSEESPKKPAARTVRMPFDQQDSDDKVKAEKSAKVVQHDPDSQSEQEEPRIESGRKSSDRDAQGVDALKATKPGAHRREVRVADPSEENVTAPIVRKTPLEPELEKRLQKATACLNHYLKNPESTSVRSPWAVMHALIAFGAEYELIHGQGRVNAIGWMCHNGICRTQHMFTPKGRGFVPNVGGGVQGHEGQFLAILAQSNVPLDYPIQIGSTRFTVEDLVRYEMATCKEKSELTFKLIGLSYYLDSNKQWKANDGKVWSIPKLIQEELAQPIVGSACGGTHRLMGFSFSVRQRQLQNLPINGQYARAAKFVREYVAYTFQLQNPDGSFSTDWYEGRANDSNEERKVQTTGHMLEWLMYTLSDEEIKQPKIAKSIDFVLTKIYDKREHKWPIGPRGHATRAVALYLDRMSSIAERNAPASTTPPNAAISSRTQGAAPIIRK